MCPLWRYGVERVDGWEVYRSVGIAVPEDGWTIGFDQCQ